MDQRSAFRTRRDPGLFQKTFRRPGTTCNLRHVSRRFSDEWEIGTEFAVSIAAAKRTARSFDRRAVSGRGLGFSFGGPGNGDFARSLGVEVDSAFRESGQIPSAASA